MSTTNFIDNSTIIAASWANDVDSNTYGILSAGVTNAGVDTTSTYTAALSAAVSAGKGLDIPKGTYLVSGTTYDVRGDFLWRDTGFGTVDAIAQAETKNILLTGATPNTSPADAKDSLTVLGIVAKGYGAQHCNAARFDLYNYSSNSDGNCALYTAVNTDTTSTWAVALHGESKHGGGTTLAGNLEAACYSASGTFIGLNIQNSTNNAAATHPITGASSIDIALSKAIQIQGTGSTAKGKWSYGIYFPADSIKTAVEEAGSTAIRIDSASTYGLYINSTAVHSIADVLLGANSALGLVCNGTYTEAAIRVANNQYIGLTTSGVVKYRYNTSTAAIEFENSGVRVAFEVDSNPVLKFNGTQVLKERITGWSAATGSATRTTFATTTVTTAQLAERVKALIDDLTLHGLIGA